MNWRVLLLQRKMKLLGASLLLLKSKCLIYQFMQEQSALIRWQIGSVQTRQFYQESWNSMMQHKAN